jgi:hypothetical protein
MSGLAEVEVFQLNLPNFCFKTVICALHANCIFLGPLGLDVGIEYQGVGIE